MNFCQDIVIHGPDKMGTFEIFLGQILVVNKNIQIIHLFLGLLWIHQEQVKRMHKEYDNKVWFGLCCLMTPGLSKDIRCCAWPYFF